MQLNIRQGVAADVPEILALIQHLADFEKAPQEVAVTEADLLKDGFGDKPLFDVLIAEADGQVAGMALYYTTYSTWKGHMVYLEDLIVKEAMRGNGIGKQLLDATIAAAEAQGARLVKWQVLDWNQPAIDFYKSYGADFDDEWVNVRLMLKDNTKKK